jgi:DNA-binding transcriptional LysR family regulator
LDGSLDLTVMGRPAAAYAARIEFEELRRYPFCVATAPAHPFARLKSVSVQEVAGEPLVVLHRRDYSEFHRILDNIFSPYHLRPRIAVECDGASSLITEVAAGRGVALVSKIFQRVAGKRLIYRPLSNSTEAHTVGIAGAAKRETRPAEERFCEIVRKISADLPQPKDKPETSRRSNSGVRND